MTLRPCLDCGTPTTGSRCSKHERARYRERAQRTGRDGSTHRWRKTRARILRRDNHTCQYCGQPATTVDHLTPKIRGGTDHDTNLVAACAACNARKGARGEGEDPQSRPPDTPRQAPAKKTARFGGGLV